MHSIMTTINFNYKHIAVFICALFFLYLIYLLWGPSGINNMPDIHVELKELINFCILASQQGGHVIRMIAREENLTVSSKGRTKEGAREVLTQADLLSNAVIMDQMKRFPGVKIISEEKNEIDPDQLEKFHLNNYLTYLEYSEYLKKIPSKKVSLSDISVWVDPLDATQEFTEGLTEYVTVMLCIVVSGVPIFGVVHRPFFNETVWGAQHYGIFPDNYFDPSKSVKEEVVVVSRSHKGKVEEVLNSSGINARIDPVGGAGYKSLRVLNKTASAYVHVTAIKKWDICAGDAILRSAGGGLKSLDGNIISYFPKDQVVHSQGLLGVVEPAKVKMYKKLFKN